jgi:hypothetical protein
MQYSVTIASLIVIVLGWLGVGDLVTQDELSNGINLVIQLVGIIGVWYGRYRQGDINPLGFRK